MAIKKYPKMFSSYEQFQNAMVMCNLADKFIPNLEESPAHKKKRLKRLKALVKEQGLGYSV